MHIVKALRQPCQDLFIVVQKESNLRDNVCSYILSTYDNPHSSVHLTLVNETNEHQGFSHQTLVQLATN